MKAPSYTFRLIWPVPALVSIFLANLPLSADEIGAATPAITPNYTSASLVLLDPPALPAPVITSGNSGPMDRWTLVNSGETTNFYGVRWIANQFVALGQHNIMTSPDGVTWKSPGASLTDTFYDIATNGKLFIAVGDKGGVATSPDLKNWTSQTSSIAGRLFGIFWFNGRFLATGESGIAYASSDGLTWLASKLASNNFHHGTIAGSNLVIADGQGLTITDGTSSSHISKIDRMLDVAYNGNLLVAVGSAPDTVWISLDGLNWQKSNPGSTEGLATVAWTGTQFVAAGSNTTVLSSTDGKMWSVRSLGNKANIYAVAGHGDTVVAVTSSGEIFTNQSVAAVTAPEISFAPGPAGSVPQLEIKCATAGAKIFLSEDGKDPSMQATPYAAPFSPAQSETIKVRAYKDGLAQSAITSANFIITPSKTPP